jgi:peptidoglycan hydrolase-like protein with peptidoglycan-binding domain
MKRRTIAIGLLIIVLVAAAAGWLAGRLIQSPAEVAARRAPPEPSPILVPVETRRLSADVVTRGTARFGSPQTLSLTPTRLKSGRQLVTRLPAPGTKLGEGDVVLTVSGRPVFLLKGREPSYRDLGPGIAGKDVRQLEAAMKRIGVDPGPADGLFDAGTERAVEKLYARAGFEAMRATEAQLQAIRPLEAELLDNARARAGIQLPADEMIFVSRTPVRVTKLPLDRGDRARGAVMTVTDVTVAIDSAVPIEEAPLVKRGMKVRIDEPDLGIKETGVVSDVAKTPGTEGVDGFHVYIEVLVDGAPPTLVGASVRLTIPVKSTEGEVLAVPASALSLGPDGSSRIQRAIDGGLEFVQVEPGLSAGGFVEVTPIEGTLEPTDRVVIGFRGGAEARA